MQIPQIYLNKKGFTLVETLVAVTVLLLVIIGPMTIAQKGIQNAGYAKDQFTAVYLAQEALEAVREARDADAIEVYANPTEDTSDWVNLYVPLGAVSAPFSRSVTVGAASGGGVPVTVDVSWNANVFGGSTKHVVLQTWIYDQYERYDN